MFNTYLALTTGPIYSTMQQARSTRAIWSASYLFSFFMKNVISKFREGEVKRTFLVPYIDPTNERGLFTKTLKCGLFHDRFIFKQENEDDFETLQGIIKAEVISIAKKIATDLTAEEESVVKYLLHYFRNCTLKIEIDEQENPIETIDKILDSLELQPAFNAIESRNYLKDFIELKTSKNDRSFLVEHAFRTELEEGRKDEIRFDSVLEITTSELSETLYSYNKGKYWEVFKENREKKDEQRFADLLSHDCNKGKELFRYHKYLAVLQADGDKLGELIKQLFTAGTGEVAKRFEGLSKALFDFDTKAIDIIESYGGMPVYVGGDDILCLAPLKAKGKNIFTLVEELDDAFRTLVVGRAELKEALAKVDQIPTMTYGISISYYKHPMNEALSEAFHQMRYVAKEKRNAVSFRLLKHSGSHFGAVFRKPKKNADDNEVTLYKNHFLKLLNMPIREWAGKDSGNSFLSSLQYKLNENFGVLEAILHDDVAIDNFFKNNFNENVHHESAFINAVRDAVKQAWKEFDRETMTPSQKKRQTISTVHAMLRYVQFINQKAQDE